MHIHVNVHVSIVIELGENKSSDAVHTNRVPTDVKSLGNLLVVRENFIYHLCFLAVAL